MAGDCETCKHYCMTIHSGRQNQKAKQEANMKHTWVRTWKASTQPRKQRKFTSNAPEHRRRKLLSAHLNPELRKKQGTRSLPLRAGDTVRILRGDAKGKTGKVERVDSRSLRIQVAGIEVIKKDGSKSPRFISPSNVIVTDLVLSDKRRTALPTKLAKKQAPSQEQMKSITKA